MNVCVFTDEISPDFEEAAALARAAGADRVELRGGLFGHDVTTVTAEEIVQIQAILSRNGLRVASIGSPLGKCNFDHPEELQRQYQMIPGLIALGRALGCHLIRGFAFWNPNGRDLAHRACLPAYLEAVAAALRPMVLDLQAAGFVYGLELAAETFVATGAEVQLLSGALGDSPALGVVWDLDAEFTAGELPYPDGYRLMRDRIVHVHIKPNEQGNMVTLRGSTLTHGEILVALREDGYHGAVSIEHWGSSQKMLEGVRQLRTAIDALGPPVQGAV